MANNNNAHLQNALSRAASAIARLTPVREQEAIASDASSSSVESPDPDDLRPNELDQNLMRDMATWSNGVTTTPIPDGMVPSSAFITPPNRVLNHPGAPENLWRHTQPFETGIDTTITPVKLEPDGEYRSSSRQATANPSDAQTIETNRLINDTSNLSISDTSSAPLSALLVPPKTASFDDLVKFFYLDLRLTVSPDRPNTITDLLSLWRSATATMHLPAYVIIGNIAKTFMHANNHQFWRVNEFIDVFGHNTTSNFVIACSYLTDCWKDSSHTVSYRAWLAAREHFYLNSSGIQAIQRIQRRDYARGGGPIATNLVRTRDVAHGDGDEPPPYSRTSPVKPPVNSPVNSLAGSYHTSAPAILDPHDTIVPDWAVSNPSASFTAQPTTQESNPQPHEPETFLLQPIKQEESMSGPPDEALVLQPKDSSESNESKKSNGSKRSKRSKESNTRRTHGRKKSRHTDPYSGQKFGPSWHPDYSDGNDSSSSSSKNSQDNTPYSYSSHSSDSTSTSRRSQRTHHGTRRTSTYFKVRSRKAISDKVYWTGSISKAATYLRQLKGHFEQTGCAYVMDERFLNRYMQDGPDRILSGTGLVTRT